MKRLSFSSFEELSSQIGVEVSRVEQKRINGGTGGGGGRKLCGWAGSGYIDCTGGTCFLCHTDGHVMCICCSVSQERACLGSPTDPPNG